LTISEGEVSDGRLEVSRLGVGNGAGWTRGVWLTSVLHEEEEEEEAAAAAEIRRERDTKNRLQIDPGRERVEESKRERERDGGIRTLLYITM
jgi:hypothetical protein